MKKQIITATFTRAELQEIGIALMGRSNVLAEVRGEGNKEADKEYAAIPAILDKVSALLQD